MNILRTRVTGKEVKKLSQEEVVFDPYNQEHRQAFRIFVLSGRQTELRFELEGFPSVPAMMMYKMAVFGAGAIDKVSENTRVALAKRAHIHAVPTFKPDVEPFADRAYG